MKVDCVKTLANDDPRIVARFCFEKWLNSRIEWLEWLAVAFCGFFER